MKKYMCKVGETMKKTKKTTKKTNSKATKPVTKKEIIKKEEKKIKNSLKLIILVSTLIILLLTLGITYALFTPVFENAEGRVVTVTSGTLELTLADGENVIGNKTIRPGDTAVKDFSITNSGTIDTTYDLWFSEVMNNFVTKSELVYTLVSNDGGANISETEVPSDILKTITGQAITAGATHHYTLTITYKNTDRDQRDNVGKIFNFKLSIKEAKKVTVTTKYYLDNVEVSEIPDNTHIYNSETSSCNHDATITFDTTNWTYSIGNVSNKNTTCNLYFENNYYKDNSGANYPELFNGLIPVYYDTSGNTIYANLKNEWYNYDNHNWANAVVVKEEVRSTYIDNNGEYKTLEENTQIPDSDILQYYVWVPRYEYELFNTNDDGSSSSTEQMINVNFQKTTDTIYNGTSNGDKLTHPAFWFDKNGDGIRTANEELTGFWVGKFEPSYEGTESGMANGVGTGTDNNLLSSCTTTSCSVVNNIRILPNTNSLRRNLVKYYYNVTRSIANYEENAFGFDNTEVDSHMMKNMEWGAVAYLSASKYGLHNSEGKCHRGSSNYNVDTMCSIFTNPYYDNGTNKTTKTGCSGTRNYQATQTTCQAWNDSTYGGLSSTSGTFYGIYDMSGGSQEYLMGNVNTQSQTYTYYNPSNNGPSLTTEEVNRYVTLYYNTTGEKQTASAYANGLLGDATKEVLSSTATQSWYGDTATFPRTSYPFLLRGGYYQSGSYGGIFAFDSGNATAGDTRTFRVVLANN